MSTHKLINNKTVILLLFLPFVEPFGTESMATYLGGIWTYIHMVFSILKWMSFLVIAFTFIRRRLQMSIIVWLLVIYQMWIITITIIRLGITFSQISNSITAIGAALLFEYYLSRGDQKTFLRVVELTLTAWIILNFITIVLYPNGMYVDNRNWRLNWILGYKNIHIYYYLPFLAISAISQYIRNKRLKGSYYAMVVLAIISAYLAKSFTTLLAVFLFFCFIILFADKTLPAFMNMNVIYITSMIISIFVIKGSVSRIIETFNIFNKDASTVSSRIYIWQRARSDLIRHPLLGNGLVRYTTLFKTWDVTQMHNMYLDVLTIGGIVLLIILSLIIYTDNQCLKESSVPFLRNVIIFVFLAYSVLFVAEARRDMALLSIFFVVVSYLPHIIDTYDLPIERRRKIRFITINKKGLG